MNGGGLARLRVKFARFDWEERRCLAEAVLLLLFAAPAVKLLPLTLLGRIASAGPGRMPEAAGNADRVEVLTWMVGWAVDRAAKRSPLRAKCFEQGLAAQIMLRRRGIDSTLLYGVSASTANPLHAHVWIETVRFPVIGLPDAGAFALLASWPPGRPAIWAQCVEHHHAGPFVREPEKSSRAAENGTAAVSVSAA